MRAEQTPSSRPSNPYASAGHPNRSLEERVAVLEERSEHQAMDLTTAESRLDTLSQAGSSVIKDLPVMMSQAIASHLAPLDRRMRVLETAWWEPMRPHLWKLYMAAGFLVLSKVHKALFGTPLDILTLISLLKGG